MISKIKKPVSILLSLIMVFSMFTIVPLSASAAVGDYVAENDSLTFTAEQDGSSVTIRVASGSLRYKKNDSDWEPYTAGTQINLDKDDSVRFRGTGTTFNGNKHVSLTGKVACSGNVMSLRLDDDGKVQGLDNDCFQYMFYNCTSLTQAPELPETTLANNCYSYMFYGCTSLTAAPELPATTLASYCYKDMFNGCTSLTAAPSLPATTMVNNCYQNMFYGCKGLTATPDLPATTLANRCYTNMFTDCKGLTEPPALPATTLETYCYSNMFNGCTKICISAQAGTFNGITYSVEYRIPSAGTGTTANYALNNMFLATGGEFKGTPDINTTYYLPGPAPATNPDQDAADAVIALINAIGTVEYTAECEAKITAARNAYDALTATQKDLVTNYTTLTDAETAYAALAPAPKTYNGITFQPWTATDSLPTSGNWYLTGNVKPGDHCVINDASAPLSLLLNGQTIDLSNGVVIGLMNGATFNLYDEDNTGVITGGTGSNGYGAAVYGQDGTFNMYGGTITGCSANNGGGAVLLMNTSAFNMYGGVITGNYGGYGGGVYVYSGTFTMYDGTLSNNTGYYGGGILVDQNGTFVMNGGTITGNTGYYYGGGISSYGTVRITGDHSITYNTAGYGGGGIELEYGGKLYMNGGVVTNNRVTYQDSDMYKGGGVHVPNGSECHLQGNVQITNNYQGSNGETPNNMFVRTEALGKVFLDAPLTDEAIIGVGTNAAGGTFTGSENTNYNDASKFTSDSASYIIGKNAAGQLLLGAPCTVIFVDGNGTELQSGQIAYGAVCVYNSEEPTKAEDANNTYTFSGWDDGTNKYAADALPTVSCDVTYTAVFDATPKAPAFTGESLTLAGDAGLDVNFYVSSGGLDAEDLTVEYSVPFDEETIISKPMNELPYVEGRGYLLAVSVPAKEMNDPIQVKIKQGDTVVNSMEYAAADYARSIYAASDDDLMAWIGGSATQQKVDNLRELCRAMLVYGAKAQALFDYNTGNLATAGVDDTLTALDETELADLENNYLRPDINAYGLNYYGCSMVLLSETSFRLYFTGTVQAGFAAELVDAPAGMACAVGDKNNGAYTYVDITGIPARELLSTFTLRLGVKDGGAFTDYQDFEVKPGTYIRAILTDPSSTAEARDAVTAIYRYCKAAIAYFG